MYGGSVEGVGKCVGRCRKVWCGVEIKNGVEIVVRGNGGCGNCMG